MGRSKNISRSKVKRRVEERTQYDIALNKILKQSKKRFKKFEIIIEDEFNQCSNIDYNDQRINTLRYYFGRNVNKKQIATKTRFKDVLIYLVKIKSAIVKHDELIHAVYNLCDYKYSWINDVFKWKPISNNADNQFRELAFYLVCKFPVPMFFYKVWLMKDQRDFIPWFIKLGQGLGVKTFHGVPINMTKKMRYYFLLADDDYSVGEAIRYGQVRGMGGDEILAKRIVASRLGCNGFNNEILWSKFIQIIIQGGMFNLDKLGEIIDYVREKLREDTNYSLKGRTLQSLLRQSDEWHQFMIKSKTKLSIAWLPSKINEFTKLVEKGDDKIGYYIIEILDSKMLVKEGRKMGHCVGSYSSYCARGRTAIFSLRKYVNGSEEERMATIEINVANKVIVQAKAKFNGYVSKNAMSLVKNWADINRLTISKYL